jgi:hypothetical protein
MAERTLQLIDRTADLEVEIIDLQPEHFADAQVTRAATGDDRLQRFRRRRHDRADLLELERTSRHRSDGIGARQLNRARRRSS